MEEKYFVLFFSKFAPGKAPLRLTSYKSDYKLNSVLHATVRFQIRCSKFVGLRSGDRKYARVARSQTFLITEATAKQRRCEPPGSQSLKSRSPEMPFLGNKRKRTTSYKSAYLLVMQSLLQEHEKIKFKINSRF